MGPNTIVSLLCHNKIILKRAEQFDFNKSEFRSKPGILVFSILTCKIKWKYLWAFHSELLVYLHCSRRDCDSFVFCNETAQYQSSFWYFCATQIFSISICLLYFRLGSTKIPSFFMLHIWKRPACCLPGVLQIPSHRNNTAVNCITLKYSLSTYTRTRERAPDYAGYARALLLRGDCMGLFRPQFKSATSLTLSLCSSSDNTQTCLVQGCFCSCVDSEWLQSGHTIHEEHVNIRVKTAMLHHMTCEECLLELVISPCFPY